MKMGPIWLILNHDCNNRCIWCYAEGSKIDKSFLSLEEAKKRVNLLFELKVKTIVLIGGEPTLYPFLREIILYINKKGIGSVLITNGKLISNEKYLKSLISAGLKNINISLEGYNSKTHDLITKSKGSFNLTLKAIRNCIKNKIRFTTLTTISTKNKTYLTKIIDLLKKEGLEKIAFNICGPSIEKHNIDCVPSPSEISKVIKKIYIHSKNKKIKIKITTAVPKCIFKKGVYKELIKNKIISNKKNCGIFGGSSFALDVNGDVLPCTHWISLPVGNIKKDKLTNLKNFKKFWERGKASKFRKKLLRYPNIKCSNCNLWASNCIGGCPLFWMIYKPKDYIKGFK